MKQFYLEKNVLRDILYLKQVYVFGNISKLFEYDDILFMRMINLFEIFG
jgi:hypothetical protein